MAYADLDVPSIKAWQAAYSAFREAAGSDVNIKLQYSIAWAACMNACMAYHLALEETPK
jgi:hypothetical protein